MDVEATLLICGFFTYEEAITIKTCKNSFKKFEINNSIIFILKISMTNVFYSIFIDLNDYYILYFCELYNQAHDH